MDQKGKMHATRIVLLKPAKYEGPPSQPPPTSNTINSSFNNKTHQQRGNNKRSFLGNVTLYAMSPSTWGQKKRGRILYV